MPRPSARPGPVTAPLPAPLGGIAPAAFLRTTWQRRARLVRAAIPGFSGPFDRASLFALACRDDVESRLVVRERSRWTLAHGPFRPRDFRTLPARNWTLLVQGTNLVDARADALMRRFDFVPWARLDDLMASYAAPGGGVGPHLDAYDVFLLQGMGRRRWRWGRPGDRALVPGRPLKLLANFAPAHDAVLEPGDMLYLPPDVAHDGVAVDACVTYSIGFRAPLAQEVAQAFLLHAADHVALAGRYEDSGLAPSSHPGRIDPALRTRYAAMLARLRFDRGDLDGFLGAWLTEPKAQVVFDPPERSLSAAAFARAIARDGIATALATQMLYDERAIYINGERYRWPAGGRASLARLADRRALSASDAARLPAAALAFLHEGYRHGWFRTGSD